MRTYTGLDLVQRLLAGQVSGSQLETALTTNAALYLGPWREILKATELRALLNSPTALAAIFGSATAFAGLLDTAGALLAASDGATELIAKSSSAMITVVSNTDYLDLWVQTPANKTRLNAWVNATGSKIRRQDFTSSGDYTPHADALLVSYSIVAGGQDGWQGGVHGGGGGGGGGEIRTVNLDDDVPGVTAVALGEKGNGITAAGNTTFGAISATGAPGGGSNSATGRAGGGSNVGTVYDTALSTAIWQPTTAQKQGGTGGAGRAVGSGVGAGSAGLGDFGGDGGPSGEGGDGGGFGSGGGGGGYSTGSSNPPAGAAATANTGGGSGGSGYQSGFGGGSTQANSAAGRCVVHEVIS